VIPARLSLTISDRHFGRLVVGFVALGFLALLAAGAAAGWVMVENQDRVGWVTHSYEVERRINGFRDQLERLETARRGYLLDEDPLFRQAFDAAGKAIPMELSALRQLTVDDPVQRRRIDSLEAEAMRLQSMLLISMTDTTLGRVERAETDFRTDGSVVLAREMRSVTSAMLTDENKLLAKRLDALQRTTAIFYAVLLVSAVLLVIVGTGSILVILRYTADLARSRDSLRALNDTLELAVEARTADLRRANEEIQRFAYIVSHDLRAPLVNVLGFTSELEAARRSIAGLIERTGQSAPHLLTDEARQAIDEDIPEAIGFIRASTEKMDRLINAILKLSREGRRTIIPEPLDLDLLARGVADSLRHRLDDLGAQIAIETPLPPLISDKLAVEQILSNLVENAVKYLKPGRPGRIRISGRCEHGRTTLEVADNGRGIDPKDHERVFELFRRAGVQDQPGEGIGLAHVRALAYRLGGNVTCDSALDRGAAFRLSLPTTAVTEDRS
jgi:signal transduction histidine kinase